MNGKLVVLKEEYIATTSSLRTETQTLTQSLQVSKSQQVSIEKRVNEIDSGNQQLLEKILAVNKTWREKCKELIPTLAISQTKSCLLKMRLNYLIIYLSRLEYV